MQPAIVYKTPTCFNCGQTCRMLDKHGIPYETKDITTDPDAMERVKALGYGSVPVVEAAGRDWYGHRPDIIAEIAPQFAT